MPHLIASLFAVIRQNECFPYLDQPDCYKHQYHGHSLKVISALHTLTRKYVPPIAQEVMAT
ncbi:hypothetical protein [Endozoicomonas euniceicola]|uniref:Uncharacterized protein n=1 Tax=Endozoicomonas euniceicola TaxID=1234143 RepID=A0ABY6H334_9GAMM|nr:hypothetical protein [Endozoicomonas euniceicola]UYM18643.1 hypothetical protein NX720_12315 [Endozoicomonas euniceicola]